MIRPEQQARADLHDLLPTLCTIVRRAIEEFLTKYGHLRADQTKRSEASIIHDLMVKHARLEFDGQPGIKLSLKNNLFLIHIEGKYSIKLKKLNNGKWPVNNVTQLVIDFRDQSPQMHLPGVEPPPTNLYLGYERSEDSVELSDLPVWLVCPRGQGVAWAIRLDDAVSTVTRPGATAGVIPIASEEEHVARARVRRTPADAEDETEDRQG